MSRAWAEVDAGAVRSNVSELRRATGRGLIAVVKANGYGHGAAIVGQAALEAGARTLAVATVGEAEELREALGREAPLLVLGAILEEEALAALACRASTVVHDSRDVEAIARTARSLGRPAPVHVEVDLGLARHGVAPERALALVGEVLGTRGVEFEGLMAHLPCAESREVTLGQLSRFDPIVAAVRRRAPGILVHAAASTAALRHEKARYDAIRPGIALHGIDPEGAARAAGVALRPTLSLRSRVVRVREVEAGTPVGYGATWTAPRASRLAVVALGYDDGLPYRLSNQGTLLVHGRRCPIVGTVMMDYVLCDVTDAPPVAAGDVATAIGTDGQASIGVEEVARAVGVIPYAVTCGIGRRVRRVALDAAARATAAPAPVLTASAQHRRTRSG